MTDNDLIRLNPPQSVIRFGPEAQDMYRELLADITRNGTVLMYQDRHSLGELAVTLCEMNELRQELRNTGEYLEVQGDRNKVTKKNPSREALEKLRPTMLRLLKEFQMTPGSRPTGKHAPTVNPEASSDGFGDI